MNITYSDKKDIIAYRDFVCNATDRNAQRRFRRYYPAEIEKAAVKLHNRLHSYSSVAAYNAVYGRSDNRIELLLGVGENERLIVKTRINDSYRKFFHIIAIKEDFTMLIKRDWGGTLDETMTDLYVIEVNNHDYNGI